MIKKDDLPYCPVSTTMKVIGSKWKIIIIQKLEIRTWRFNELLREINGISRRVLSETLRSMENDGILERIIRTGSPSHLEYSLNDLGHSLLPILKEMEKWGIYYREYKNMAKISSDSQNNSDG